MLLFVFGCSTKKVLVTDQYGTPLEGAKVIGTSLSISGAQSTTNKKGIAPVPMSAQPPVWLTVSKEGYNTRENIDLRYSQFPLHVVLQEHKSSETK